MKNEKCVLRNFFEWIYSTATVLVAVGLLTKIGFFLVAEFGIYHSIWIPFGFYHRM
jgi:hypothetical protein